MADYLTTDTELTSIANAIRTKGGTSASLTYPTGYVTAINNLPSLRKVKKSFSLSSDSTTISVTGLNGAPTCWSLRFAGALNVNSSSSSIYYIVSLLRNESMTEGNSWNVRTGNMLTNTGNATGSYSSGTYTITLSASSFYFKAGSYTLLYVY